MEIGTRGVGDYNGFDAAEGTLPCHRSSSWWQSGIHGSPRARPARELLAVERQARSSMCLLRSRGTSSPWLPLRSISALTQEGVVLARGTVDDVDLRVRAAKSPEGELLRYRAALSRAGLDEQRAMAEWALTRRACAAMWGSARAATAKCGPTSTACRR